MAKQNGNEVFAIQSKLPTFSKRNTKLFFVQLDAAFTLNKIEDEITKYNYLISILDTEILSSVSDLILTIPPQKPFTTLKDRLSTLFEHSMAQNTKALLQELTLGDQKPSILLRKMKELASGQVTDDFLKNLWLQRLPTNIQTVLAVSGDELDKLAILADKVSELSEPHSNNMIAAVAEHNEYKILQVQINELTKKIEELTLQNSDNRSRSPYRGRRRSNSFRNRSNSRHFQSGGQDICFYHYRFGAQARKCKRPCIFNTSGNDGSASQ
jgi:hypothetical protein